MTEHSFSLIPFPGTNIPDIKITGTISRKTNSLTLHYFLTGNIASILIPDVSLQPARKDELWTATCFEFFLAIPDQAQYWEFNLSPSGDWNIYHMDMYRRVGFREEMRIQRLPFSVQRDSGCVSLDAAADLNPIIQSEDLIQVGIASIIQTNDGHETYWALSHPNPLVDFHLRESFTLALAG